jgi:ATP-dependent Clp protease ATP-binding subunit ClpC
MGMLSDVGCPAERILSSLGATPNELCAAIESQVGPTGPRGRFENGLTFRANLVIEMAVNEVLRADAPFVGSEHFLIAILREGGGVAVRVLHDHGIDLETVRAEAVRLRRFRIWQVTAGDIGERLAA